MAYKSKKGPSKGEKQLELFGLGEVETKRDREDEVFLRAKPVVEIREEPNTPKTIFSVRKSDFYKAAPQHYLLLGFDSEYQSRTYEQEEVKAGKAKYEVLSYQFYAGVGSYTCSGIAIPDTKMRLTFAEFLIFALANAARGGEKIPTKIVLVGHYNRADIPAFSDKDQWWTQLKSVRNSLVSESVPITVRIQFGDQDDEDNRVELKVHLRDTMLLAPAGKKSLAELGKLINQEKIQLADNANDERFIKQNMKFLREANWPKFKEYALRDAKVSALYFEEIARLYRNTTGAQTIPTSLSSIGIRLLLEDWSARELNTLEMVGKELHSEKYWDDKNGVIREQTVTPYLEELSWHIDFLTDCYHGGRNEQFWFGPSFEDDWTDYDLTSAYPTAMATIGRPLWREIREMKAADLNEIKIGSLAFAYVDFEFPRSVRYPTLPIRTANGIVFPRRGRSYCAAPEIVLARELGCKLRLRRGIIIPQDADDLVFYPFIKDALNKRLAAKSDIEAQFYKEMANSCYGKTAQGLRDKRVFGLKTGRTKRLPESEITNPAYAAFITSFVRAVDGEIMNRIPADKMVFSVTTDGFITNATSEQMRIATSGPLARRYQETSTRLTGANILKAKHAVRQVLGWRTRGQATIIPGQREGIEKVVLAKAGIRPPVWATETDEQNDWIVETFLDRSGATLIEMDVLTSLREMLLYDADLVPKSTRKNMPMEFDFKRQPHAVGELRVRLPNGKEFTHAAFNTDPFNTVEEFRLTRDIWDSYRRDGENCIRTVEEFTWFAEYMDRTRSVSEENRRYWGKDDRDGLKRFRRDLCFAFKNGEAGFEGYQNISNKEFAQILNEAGFKDSPAIVRDSHVENGKRRKFEPNASAPTRQVLVVMRALKQRFPELRENEFLGALLEGMVSWLKIVDRQLFDSPSATLAA